MAQIQASPSAEEYYLPGYSLLRACITEAQAVLAAPYAQGSSANPGGNLEAEKAQLRAYDYFPSISRPFFPSLTPHAMFWRWSIQSDVGTNAHSAQSYVPKGPTSIHLPSLSLGSRAIEGQMNGS